MSRANCTLNCTVPPSPPSQDMKRGCRQEESMLRVAEYLCAAARIKNPDYVYPREELDRIWKTLLLNQFHDILPGSATHGYTVRRGSNTRVTSLG